MTRQARIDRLIRLADMQRAAGRAIIAAALRTKQSDPRAQALCDQYRAALTAIRETTG